MKVGDLVHDYALGMNGIVIGGAFTENGIGAQGLYDWEWTVLLTDGEIYGADSSDLKVIE